MSSKDLGARALEWWKWVPVRLRMRLRLRSWRWPMRAGLPAAAVVPAVVPAVMSAVMATVMAAGCAQRAPALDAAQPADPPAAPGTPPSPPATLVNSLGMAFVLVPAGAFDMGSDDETEALARHHPTMEAARLAELSDERPRHRVQITRSFWLGRHEVTVGQFRRFLALSGHVPQSVADGTGGYGWRADYDPARSARGDAFEGRDPRYGWFNPGFPQTDAHPVTNVTWNDAVAMARWLSQHEGVRYRLPTEAEWEYACRAGAPRDAASTDPARLQGRANLFDQDSAALWPHWRQHAMPWRDGFVFTAPVGSFAPNAFGLHDMLGNVWEWVSDWYGDDTYGLPPERQVDPTGPDDGHVRVRRGGSWHSWALYTRCAYRNVNTAGTRYTLVGMRLLRETGP